MCCFFEVFASIFEQCSALHHASLPQYIVQCSVSHGLFFYCFSGRIAKQFFGFGAHVCIPNHPKTLFRCQVAGKLTRPPASVPSNHGLALSIKWSTKAWRPWTGGTLEPLSNWCAKPNKNHSRVHNLSGNGASIMWCETIPNFYMLKDPMIFQPLLEFQALPSWLLSCSTVTSGMFRESLATSVVFLGFSAKTKNWVQALNLKLRNAAIWCNMYVFVCVCLYLFSCIHGFVRSFVHAFTHLFIHFISFCFVSLYFVFFIIWFMYLLIYAFTVSNLSMYSFFDVCTVLVYFLFVYFHM